MSGMAEVIAAHQNKGLAFRNAESGALYDCSCGRRFSDSSEHLADALTAAGFGLVKTVEEPEEVEPCEHGLSAWLCEGPNHYPEDRPW